MTSNTSSLNIFDPLPARRQAKSLIAHWYAPPYIVDLVDVVPGPETEPEALSAVKDLLESLGKKPIVLSKFISGFIANRLQAALNLEVFFLLDQGTRHQNRSTKRLRAAFVSACPYSEF